MPYPMIRRGLNGTIITENPLVTMDNPIIEIDGFSEGRRGTIGISSDALSKGFLACGATGMGKTVMTKECIRQIRVNANKPYSMVVLEVKDDYSCGLRERGDLVIGQGMYHDQSIRWNIYKDILFHANNDQEIELRCREIARILFRDRKNQAQQFFPDAAQLLFGEVLFRFIKQGEHSLTARRKLTNKGLRNFFQSFSKERYKELIGKNPSFTDLLLGDMDNQQALGVVAEEILTVINTFSDVFGDEGDFSIQSFVLEKRNTCLFVKMNFAYKETQKRIFGLLVNLILREVLSHENTAGDVYLILDELHALGEIDLVSAINLGRSKGLKVIAGIQSYAQLKAIYGENGAAALIAGFGSKAYFRPNDEETKKLIKEEFVQCVVEEIRLSAGGSVVSTRPGSVVEDADLNEMQVGDFICSLTGHPPFRFKMEKARR